MTIPAAELAQIQADLVAQVLDKSVDLYEPVASTDAYGSPINTWPTLTSTTVCGMQQPTSTHLENFDFKIGAEASWLVHFPVNTTIGEQWHAIVEGSTLEVHVILTPQSIPGLLSTICAEIK